MFFFCRETLPWHKTCICLREFPNSRRMLVDLHNTYRVVRQKKGLGMAVKYTLTAFFHSVVLHLCKDGKLCSLINSGMAALSGGLPTELHTTITQGGHLRSVWIWSCASVMNSCFFSFVADQHFYSAVNPAGCVCVSAVVIFHLAAQECVFLFT